MADTPKKTRTTATKTATTAKPRKAATKKNANGVSSDPVNGHDHTHSQDRSVSHDEVALLAHRFWQERGQKHGQHIEDWVRAEQELLRRAS
ncbi:MAG TPA: DUF2934 domain-containing protein [Terracidiphilus sp.]|nr:DUF2934 domain-containing protein [Terracidiphilus sp.]